MVKLNIAYLYNRTDKGKSMFIYIWKSLRPKQWTKNLCIFAGLIFSQNFTSVPLITKSVWAFAIFCMLSGAVYIINDLSDLDKDRQHPLKSHRPLASGNLSVVQAVSVLILLLPLSLGRAYFLGIPFFVAAVSYLFLQIAYSLYVKNIVILDVLTVACGFVLRVVAGALVINVEISSWLLVCTVFLALFLSLSKRRHELIVVERNHQEHRKTLDEYSTILLDQMISIVTASTVVAYALYTMSKETIAKVGTRDLIYTIPFVLYGIFRYLYLVYQKEEGGRPENILITDVPLIINVLLWIVAIGVILYVR
jgi:4-hydroxybenzoate polyprenyltransferase